MLKKIWALCLLFVMCFSVLPGVYAQEVETVAIYVSPDGDDTNGGSLEKPLKTLEGARDKAREINNGEFDIIIYLRAGAYNLDESFQLTQEDSGKNGHTITYRAYQDEEVHITGGVVLPADQFGNVTDSRAIEKISPDVIDQVKQVDLHKLGLENLTPPPIAVTAGILPFQEREQNGAELFFNDEAMTIARWPNEDYAVVESIKDAGAHPRQWDDDQKGTGEWIPPEDRDPNHGFVMGYSDSRVEKWVDEPEARMLGFWFYEWYDQIVKIKSIDTQAKTITSEQPSMYTAKAGTKYYAYNILSELDAPGEYYVDTQSGLLFFYPPADLKDSFIGYSQLGSPLISLEGTSNVRFENIIFELTRGIAVEMDENSSSNIIYNCTIRNTADKAVSISGKNNGVEYCTIYNVNGGVDISGGDRQTLEPGENYVRNSEIYKFARITKTYTDAVSLSGVGNVIANNRIHEAMHEAISFSGNDHIIENNEIYDVLLDTDDAGAIYAGRNLTMRGTVIRNNYIHHLGRQSTKSMRTGEPTTHTGAIAIYLDDGYSGTTVKNNIIFKADTGVMVNGGRNNIVTGNVMYDVTMPLYLSAIITASMGNGEWELRGYGLYQDGTKEPAVPFQSELYAKYPNMNEIETDEPRNPKYNEITSNLSNSSKLINGNYYSLGEGYYMENNTVEKVSPINMKTTDFVGFTNGDLSLKPSVITACPEVEGIRFEEIGIAGQPEDKEVEVIDIETYLAESNIQSGGSREEETSTPTVTGESIKLFLNSPRAYVGEKKTYIDRYNTSVVTITKDGRTLVPLRFIAEALGAKVDYLEEEEAVLVRTSDRSIVFSLQSNIMSVNGKEQTMDVGATILNDRTLVPLRAFAEAMDKNVFWDERGLIIISDVEIFAISEEEKKEIDKLVYQLQI